MERLFLLLMTIPKTKSRSRGPSYCYKYGLYDSGIDLHDFSGELIRMSALTRSASRPKLGWTEDQMENSHGNGKSIN